jgi:hypothetical protein
MVTGLAAKIIDNLPFIANNITGPEHRAVIRNKAKLENESNDNRNNF